MKTSMAYRLFRLYFNSNSDNYQLFGSRVNNPMNGTADEKSLNQGTFVRLLLILVTAVALATVIAL